jgi:protein-S-isoprenylcysteine O-methyltransferase Ste14
VIQYIIIISASALFGLQHSGLSALPVKERIINRWGKEGYARLFNTTSILTLLIAFLSMNFWDWLYFVIRPELIQPVLFLLGLSAVLGGMVLSMMASRVISISTVADMRTDRKAELLTDGIYSRIRHPLYLATFLIFSALALLYPFPTVIVFSLSMISYTMIGAYFEERKLVKHYGEEYLDYRKNAGFIFPKFR